MNYEDIEFADRLNRRLEDNDEHWHVSGTPVDYVDEFGEYHDGTISIERLPIFADWCE